MISRDDLIKADNNEIEITFPKLSMLEEIQREEDRKTLLMMAEAAKKFRRSHTNSTGPK